MNAAWCSEYHGTEVRNVMMGRGRALRPTGAVLWLGLLALSFGALAGCGALAVDFAPGSPDEMVQETGSIAEISVDALPPEAQATLQLIESGGSFPYEKDGSVFHNYEGLLPGKNDGYYREYTVPTPGSADRGARRIVSGEAGEKYYTDDHYASFKRVVE
jgi:ribonuclease T1